MNEFKVGNIYQFGASLRTLEAWFRAIPKRYRKVSIKSLKDQAKAVRLDTHPRDDSGAVRVSFEDAISLIRDNVAECYKYEEYDAARYFYDVIKARLWG